ncbi:hypothetical protein Tco_0516825 [Tanacetum coccineum]
MHKTNEDEVVQKLKFAAKEELKGKLMYGKKILEAMLSQAIIEFVDYLNYLAKSRNAQSCVPTLGRGREKGFRVSCVTNLEEQKQREKEQRTNTKHAALVLDKEVDQEVNEAYNDQLKFKPKAVEQISLDTQLLLDLKKTSKASREELILDDDKTKSKNDSNNASDVGDDQTKSFEILVHNKEQEQPQPELQPHM